MGFVLGMFETYLSADMVSQKLRSAEALEVTVLWFKWMGAQRGLNELGSDSQLDEIKPEFSGV